MKNAVLLWMMFYLNRQYTKDGNGKRTVEA
jgi:hypothetical protein